MNTTTNDLAFGITLLICTAILLTVAIFAFSWAAAGYYRLYTRRSVVADERGFARLNAATGCVGLLFAIITAIAGTGILDGWWI